MILILLKRIHDCTLSFCLYLSAIIITVMAVLGAADAASSAILSSPIDGTQELSQILLATSFFLVLGKVQQRQEHIVVDIVSNTFPERVRPWLVRLGTLVGAIALGVVAYRLWLNAIDAVHILQRANAAVHIPVYPFKIASAIGVSFASLECLRQTFAVRAATHAALPVHPPEVPQS